MPKNVWSLEFISMKYYYILLYRLIQAKTTTDHKSSK